MKKKKKLIILFILLVVLFIVIYLVLNKSNDSEITKITDIGVEVKLDNSDEEINITLDENSKIKLTGDSYVTSLDDSDSTYSNIDFNGYKLYINGKGIN